MNGLVAFTDSPYRPRSAHRDPDLSDESDTSSYVHGSHEDVLWSFEQQVNTMKKYGVVANSVEFEELERSLDEELKKYHLYEEKKGDPKDDTLKTMNTSELVHNGSESDSPPSSPEDILSSRQSDIDRLYKKFYRENSIEQHEFRAPSDLDYFPTKQSPKIYPKSPKPDRSKATMTGSRSSLNSNSTTREAPRASGVRSRRGSAGMESSTAGSQANLYTSTPSSMFPPATPVSFYKEVNSVTAANSSGHYSSVGPANSSSGHFSGGSSRHLSSSSANDRYIPGISPPLTNPVTRGYASSTGVLPTPPPSRTCCPSSMPALDCENIEPNKGPCGGIIDSNKLRSCQVGSRASNISRSSLRRSSLKHRPSDVNSAGSSSTASEPELAEILGILTNSSNLSLVNTAAGALQHLSYNQDDMKTKIREAGAIPVLVHMLSLDDLVCISSLGVLRNLSFGRNNHLNRIAIQDAHGITLLVQLLNTTESYEIQELVTGVFWNLSSSDTLKLAILREALEPLVQNVIIPQSGWKDGVDQYYAISNGNINWTTVFRNATGCLKNLSSAGLEGRSMLRLTSGLVDSLIWTVRAAQGKNDVDNKAVENAVCILRNLSYRLDNEIPPEIKYGQNDDWRSRGLGGGQFRRKTPEEGKKKGGKKSRSRDNMTVTPLPEHTTGVGLLWQQGVVRVYLDLLLECSNPETLEGAAGAIQNLAACSWEPAQLIREVVRREKGLSVITSLLRLDNDFVVRATSLCLRNLAVDPKNKELLGKYAMADLVRRLPGGDGSDGITDITISGVISALTELLIDNHDNAKLIRDMDGVARLLEIARSSDLYTRQCVMSSNRALAVLWDFKETRKVLKAQGWNISYYTRLHSMDKSDGMEFDERQSHFKISYTGATNGVKSPDPTFDSHVNSGRIAQQQPLNESPLTTITSSPPVHAPSPLSSPHDRSATLGRSRSLTRPYSEEIRGHSTLPNRGYQSNRYTVTDSWV